MHIDPIKFIIVFSLVLLLQLFWDWKGKYFWGLVKAGFTGLRDGAKAGLKKDEKEKDDKKK